MEVVGAVVHRQLVFLPLQGEMPTGDAVGVAPHHRAEKCGVREIGFRLIIAQNHVPLVPISVSHRHPVPDGSQIQQGALRPPAVHQGVGVHRAAVRHGSKKSLAVSHILRVLRLFCCLFCRDVLLGCEEFCAENGSAGGSPHRVVGQAHELPVVHRVLPQAADGDAHAPLKVHVQLHLGAVVLLHVLDELGGGAGEMKLLGKSFKAHQLLHQLLLGHFLAELDKHSCRVAVQRCALLLDTTGVSVFA